MYENTKDIFYSLKTDTLLKKVQFQSFKTYYSLLFLFYHPYKLSHHIIFDMYNYAIWKYNSEEKI